MNHTSRGNNVKRIAPLIVALVLIASGCGASNSANPTETRATRVPTNASPTKASPTTTSSTPTTPAPTASPTPAITSTRPAPTSDAANKARKQLRQLQVIDRQPIGLPQYVRKEFGSSWSDIDRNGCNQRDDVLLRDATKGTVKVQQQGRCPHDVVAGTWVDPYTGRTLVFTDLKQPSQSRALQIDHVVPLSEAWKSGAHAWDYEKRRKFANTLDNLLAVDGPTNMSKGDDDPAAWRPRKDFQCSYAKRWIRVKHEWNLGADKSEINALGEMLDYCT